MCCSREEVVECYDNIAERMENEATKSIRTKGTKIAEISLTITSTLVDEHQSCS